MTRYYGVDHYSNDVAGAAAWCRDNAIDDDDDYICDSRRSLRGCTCNSLSESPCDFCEEADDEDWCQECDMSYTECPCYAHVEEEDE